MKNPMKAMLTLALAAGACAPVLAQKTASQGIDEYRAMLQDGNPAELFEAKGEDLWKQKRGPKAASLEKCDLGKGPGVVKGAFVELPRYFADTQRMQDLESRIVTCMATLQGSDPGNDMATAFMDLGDLNKVGDSTPQKSLLIPMPISLMANCHTLRKFLATKRSTQSEMATSIFAMRETLWVSYRYQLSLLTRRASSIARTLRGSERLSTRRMFVV